MHTLKRALRHLYGLGVIGALIVTLSYSVTLPAAAQDGGKPGTTIHVVQRDETLYRIALRYGTTVEAIADANGITDPQYISVGQRLLIPNVNGNITGTVTLHVVEPGQTLTTLAYIYNIPADRLASTNNLLRPNALYVGQELAVPVDPDTTTPSPVTLYVVQPGENIARIALQSGVALHDLLRANAWLYPVALSPGQRIWIPRTETNTAALQDLPAPFTSLTLTPVPAIQGQTMGVRLTTTTYVTLTGSFMGYPVQIVTQDATWHYALFGIHTFANQGVYPLVLTATASDGTQTTFTTLVRIDAGGYGSEQISLDTTQQDLLNPQVIGPEWEKFARMMSSFTAQRYFEGVMGLPSAGAITSQFGTRRAYNGGVLNSFHSGTDFAGAPGSPIITPAAGMVVLAEELPVRGNCTIIDHGWGVVTAYFHQSEIYVAVGDIVNAEQTIGAVGSTGRSTGPHLHWEMWVGGVQVDPMQWVQRSFP